MRKFKFEQVLNKNKTEITLQGYFGRDKTKKAILVLKKVPWDEELVKELHWTRSADGIANLNQDSYTKESWKHYFSLTETTKLNKNLIETIFPASKKTITKYSVQKYFVVCETEKIYKKVVKPYID